MTVLVDSMLDRILVTWCILILFIVTICLCSLNYMHIRLCCGDVSSDVANADWSVLYLKLLYINTAENEVQNREIVIHHNQAWFIPLDVVSAWLYYLILIIVMPIEIWWEALRWPLNHATAFHHFLHSISIHIRPSIQLKIEESVCVSIVYQSELLNRFIDGHVFMERVQASNYGKIKSTGTK